MGGRLLDRRRGVLRDLLVAQLVLLGEQLTLLILQPRNVI